MTQSWSDNPFQGDHAGQTDLQNMENNFACLKSLFSGSGQPSNPVAGMPWFHTSNGLLKVRNAANNAWYGVMHGDTSQRMWVYRNGAMSGWAVSGSATDRVLAVKGGGTYTTGGANAGTWTISGPSRNLHTGTRHRSSRRPMQPN